MTNPVLAELKALAEKALADDGSPVHKGSNAWPDYYRASRPSTILSLIERIEGQERALEKIAVPALNFPTWQGACERMKEIARAALKEPSP